MTNAAQQFITEIEAKAAQDKKKFDAMSPLQKAEEIRRIAFNASKRHDIRQSVIDMASMLIADIKREQGL